MRYSLHPRRRQIVGIAAVVAASALLRIDGAAAQYSGNWETVVTTYAPPASPIAFPPGRVWMLESGACRKVRAALEQPAEFEFLNVPLSIAAKTIGTRHEIDVLLDIDALASDDRGSDTPITARLKNTTLHDALSILLDGQRLAYVVKNDAILITTKAAAVQSHNLSTRLYQVHDLVVLPNDAAARAPQFEQLIEIVESIRTPDWVSRGGTIGQVMKFEAPGLLVLAIRHDESGHRAVARLLNTIRRAKNPRLAEQQAKLPLAVLQSRPVQPAPPPVVVTPPNAANVPTQDPHATAKQIAADAPLPLSPPNDAAHEAVERRIRKRLNEPFACEFHDVPLAQVAEEIERRTGVAILLNVEPLSADGKGPQTLITGTTRYGTLRSALRNLLGPLGLDFWIHGNNLIVSTRSDVSQNRRSQLYLVDDLVMSTDEHDSMQLDFDTVRELIETCVRRPDWDCNGSCSYTQPVFTPGVVALAVDHDERGHDELAELLEILRSARVPEVFDAQARQASLPPTSTRVQPGSALHQGGGFF